MLLVIGIIYFERFLFLFYTISFSSKLTNGLLNFKAFALFFNDKYFLFQDHFTIMINNQAFLQVFSFLFLNNKINLLFYFKESDANAVLILTNHLIIKPIYHLLFGLMINFSIYLHSFYDQNYLYIFLLLILLALRIFFSLIIYIFISIVIF